MAMIRHSSRMDKPAATHDKKTQILTCEMKAELNVEVLGCSVCLPCSMLALESVKQSLLASSRSAGLMAGLETDTRLRHNIWS